MKKEEFIKLARKAGFVHGNPHSEIIVRHSSGALVSIEERLHQFAILVAAAEREACADILDRNADRCDPYSVAFDVLDSNAKAIRARSQE